MTTNVLLISANPDDVRAVGVALAVKCDTAFQVQCIHRMPADLGWLRQGETAVILLDLRIPDVLGIGALDRLHAAVPQIPILVFGGAGDEDRATQAVQRGAQDFLPLDHLDSYSLPRALRYAIDRKAAAEALFLEKERAQVTLDSIGDAVVSIDIHGNVTYLNSVAEKMVGWTRTEAIGRSLGAVFRIVDGATREPPLRHPMEQAMKENQPVGLAANSLLLRRDGVAIAIEDSAAPIHGRNGDVIGAVMVFHDVSASREVMTRMSHLAHHDFLTDLPNPMLLDDRISQAIALAHRHDSRFAVLFIDLDRFKDINDSMGHATGDQLLQSVAKRLQACVRGSDSVSRKGGDEFVVLLSEITRTEDAANCAEKIIAAVTETHRIAGSELRVTASIGISFYPADGVDAESLLKAADAAMFQAKESGRNQYAYFSPELHPGGARLARRAGATA